MNPGLALWLWRRTWISLRWKKNAYKALERAGQAPDAPFECDFYGLRYQGNLRNGIEFALFYYGAFEKPLLYFLRDTMARLAATGEKDEEKCAERVAHKVFYDIGANIGQHALFMAGHADEVQAFEPLATVSSRLRQHIKLNDIGNITLHEIGLSDNNGALPFYAPVGSNQGVGSFAAESLARGNEPVGELRVARADDYIREHGLPPPSLIKLDVEGFEKRALAGLAETLRAHRPVLVLEVSYGEAESLRSREDLLALLPDNYELLVFATRKVDGRTDRRRGARAKRSGAYQLIPLPGWRETDQDDLVAVPRELATTIPRSSP